MGDNAESIIFESDLRDSQIAISVIANRPDNNKHLREGEENDARKPVIICFTAVGSATPSSGEDALHGLQYSFLAAAASPSTPFPQGSVEEAFRQAIISRKPGTTAAFEAKARELSETSSAARTKQFGRYGGLTVQEHGRLGWLQAADKLPPLAINQDAVRGSLDAIRARRLNNSEMVNKAAFSLTEGLKKKDPIKINLNFGRVESVGLYITRVKCVDETDGFAGSEAGDDEILMGGLAIDESGNTTKVGPFLVGSEFEDGVSKNFEHPGKTFCKFQVPKGGDWPKNYAAVVMLAEGDEGGFADALTVAWVQAGP